MAKTQTSSLPLQQPINAINIVGAVAMDPDMFIIDPSLNARYLNGDAAGSYQTDAKFQETKASILSVGVLQPILFDMDSNGNPRVRAGVRRLEIVRQLRAENPGDERFSTIPAIPLDSTDARRLLEINLAENDARKNLSAMDWAVAIKIRRDSGMTLAEIGKELRHDKSWVSKRLKLLDLEQELQQRVHAGELDVEVAYQLAGQGQETQAAAVVTLAEEKESRAIEAHLEQVGIPDADLDEALAAGRAADGKRKRGRKKKAKAKGKTTKAAKAAKPAKQLTRKAMKSARVVAAAGSGGKNADAAAAGPKKLVTDTQWSRSDMYTYFDTLAVDKKASGPLQAVAVAIYKRMDGKISDKVLRNKLAASVRTR
jgi:ParB/RepB/Spo0J family partition protein